MNEKEHFIHCIVAFTRMWNTWFNMKSNRRKIVNWMSATNSVCQPRAAPTTISNRLPSEFDLCSDAAVLGHDCLSEMHEVRKSLVEDYKVNPQLVMDCSHEIEKHCGGRIHRAGRTIHCLMNMARSKKAEDENALSPQCVRTVTCFLPWCIL